MRAGLISVLMLVGCGGSSKPAPTPPTTPPTTTGAGSNAGSAAPKVAAGPPTADAACGRMLQLKQQNCGSFGGLPFSDVPQCVGELQKAADDPMVQSFVGCVMQPSCEEVKNCIQAAGEQATQEAPQQLRACADTASMDPVGIPAAEWDKRNGAGVTKFSQATSTKDKPIEMCGIPAENEWLATLACDDGTKPIKNNMDAENVRAGNVGAGGRCGSIIDHYRPKCGAKTYEIYIDAYVCPKK